MWVCVTLLLCSSLHQSYAHHYRRDMDETEANQKINLDRILTAVQGVWVTAVSNAEEVREMFRAVGIGNGCPAQKELSFVVVKSVIYYQSVCLTTFGTSPSTCFYGFKVMPNTESCRACRWSDDSFVVLYDVPVLGCKLCKCGKVGHPQQLKNVIES